VAENTLVTQEDLADGERLILQLDQADFPVTAALWAYDSLLETWRLIIAAPREAIESLVAAYRVVQEIIKDLGLGITLDRISLIPDDDAKLANLQALTKFGSQDVVEMPVGRTEIAGRVLDDVHLYRSDALRYERDVIKALQRVQPANAVLRSYHHGDFPRDLQADAILDDGKRLVIVETKAVSRPLGARDVFQLTGMLNAYTRSFGRPVAAMIISRSGFSISAQDAARDSSVELVQWTGFEDDEKIRSALIKALAG
jgi:hypothetical protein